MAATRLVQYLIVRKDLLSTLNWPIGALIAQTCHACSAVIHQFYSDSNTVQYLADVDNMHKIVLEVADENSLKALDVILNENNIDHKLWIEQPENFPTCIAVKPYPKDEIQKYFKKCRLYKL